MKVSVQVVLLFAFAAVTFGCSIEKCYQETSLQCCGLNGCVYSIDDCVYYNDFCEVRDCPTSCCINNRCCTEDEAKLAATVVLLICICVCCVLPACCIYCCCCRSRTTGQFVPLQPQAQYHQAPIPQQMNFPNQPAEFQPKPVVYTPPPHSINS
eukprot:TRINITY_DN843_c0_g1_i6.p1 TRINITY_DN843_c0_g1~~TRINITY_DN843_c0_g1_i6.p1  ORF type:complete len:154 (+),score=8.27 TRINITY_DN843_c0_g1_i6:97-558(+)